MPVYVFIFGDSIAILRDTGSLRPSAKVGLKASWRQIWRVAGRESGSPELLGSPRTSPEVPRTTPEVFRRLPRKFSHCGT